MPHPAILRMAGYGGTGNTLTIIIKPKYMKSKNIFGCSLIIAMLAAVAVGCKKNPIVQPLGDQGGIPIVKFYEGFPDTADGKSAAFKLESIELVSTPQSFEAVELRRDVSNNDDLNKRMVVVIENDPGAVVAYDDADDMEPLPVSSYIAEAPTTYSGNQYTVVFEPGEFAKGLKIKVPDASTLDLTKSYGLGFRIVSAEGGKIATLESSFVVGIGLKNQWDGVYTISGNFVHPNTCLVGDFFTNSSNGGYREIQLITNGTNSLRRNLGGRENLYAYNNCNSAPTYFTAVVPRYQINPDNTVTTIGGHPDNTVVFDQFTDSRYDPVTKTFYLHYGYNAQSRLVFETMRYLRPR